MTNKTTMGLAFEIAAPAKVAAPAPMSKADAEAKVETWVAAMTDSIDKRKADEAASKVAAKVAKPTPAKAKPASLVPGKAPSKAQRLRNNGIKAIARAEKTAINVTIEEAIVRAVDGTRAGEAACRVLAFTLETTFGNQWYLWDSGNMRSDNEKAIFAGLEIHRKNCQDLALDKGLSNINKPWSDAKRVQKEKNQGGRPNERNVQQWDTATHDAIRKRYKDGMKEGRLVTIEEQDLNFKLGEILVLYFQEDLSKLG